MWLKRFISARHLKKNNLLPFSVLRKRLTDFTLSNARRFYSSVRAASGMNGLTEIEKAIKNSGNYIRHSVS